MTREERETLIRALNEAEGSRMRVAEERDALREKVGYMTFLASRVAYHLAHGCDTAERARELALAEWDVGVMGGAEVTPADLLRDSLAKALVREDDLRAELEKARALLARMVAGADMWSTWEGGFPVGGDIGPAYEAAVAYLGTKR